MLVQVSRGFIQRFQIMSLEKVITKVLRIAISSSSTRVTSQFFATAIADDCYQFCIVNALTFASVHWALRPLVPQQFQD